MRHVINPFGRENQVHLGCQSRRKNEWTTIHTEATDPGTAFR